MSTLITIAGALALLALAALFSASTYYVVIRTKQAKIDTVEHLKHLARVEADEDDILGI